MCRVGHVIAGMCAHPPFLCLVGGCVGFLSVCVCTYAYATFDHVFQSECKHVSDEMQCTQKRSRSFVFPVC